MSIKDRIINVLTEVSGEKVVSLEFTENPNFGDYSCNIALIMAKSEGKNPRALAEEIKSKLSQSPELSKFVDKIEVAGPGFINFWLKTDVLVSNLMQIEEEKEKYGTSDSLKGQKIMFEYAHPNTHKAFHIGHLRNITTGETLARLYEANGAEVVRANYQGDVGLHIAKALWGIKRIGFDDPKDVKKRAEYLGKAYSTGSSAYEIDEKAKEEIHVINGIIYDKSDDEINKLYSETRQWSLDYFAEIYKRVYTKFDRFYFESEVYQKGKEIALEALKKGILKESEGAIIFPGSEYGLHDRVFISGKGVPTYEAKDLGLAKLQFSEYNPDKLIHTVGPEQSAYFQVIFKALEFIEPETKGREFHVPYGWVRLKEGKMSSRTGNVVLGEKILDDAKESIKKAYKTEDGVAEMIAVGAVKYSFLKTGLAQDISFDLKESISLEGNSGPYLQYTVARTNSVLAKASNKRMSEYANNIKLEIEELTVLRALSRFSEVIANAAKSYSPNLLCNYLYDLASKFNTFYAHNRILNTNDERTKDEALGPAHNRIISEEGKTKNEEVGNFRLALTAGTGQVLKNGLQLLGIDAPEKM
ncbi:MAG: arginine--tRNA ligase [Candidatus Woesebacteria bacterium]|nr:MAG: arginine--tRNA ligase [Candidatus Woesebacteria bacterium]